MFRIYDLNSHSIDLYNSKLGLTSYLQIFKAYSVFVELSSILNAKDDFCIMYVAFSLQLKRDWNII